VCFKSQVALESSLRCVSPNSELQNHTRRERRHGMQLINRPQTRFVLPPVIIYFRQCFGLSSSVYLDQKYIVMKYIISSPTLTWQGVNFFSDSMCLALLRKAKYSTTSPFISHAIVVHVISQRSFSAYLGKLSSEDVDVRANDKFQQFLYIRLHVMEISIGMGMTQLMRYVSAASAFHFHCDVFRICNVEDVFREKCNAFSNLVPNSSIYTVHHWQ